ncbi:MAG: hypothetical protein ACRC6V_09210 [Bacteroidales bacterium]
MFKVGDKVWSISYGWGEIVGIDHNSSYMLKVQFDDEYITYTDDGKQYYGNNRDLFFKEIPIPMEALERPRWRAEKYDSYFVVTRNGGILEISEQGYQIDDEQYECGNYFQTEEEAKESKFYKVFNMEGI